MDTICLELERLRSVNARHIKSGWRMNDKTLTDQKVIEHIAAEVVELAMACALADVSCNADNLYPETQIKEEVADVINTALHLAVRHGLKTRDIVPECLRKLKERFEDVDDQSQLGFEGVKF